MHCSRCGGWSMRLEIITEEETIEAESCVNCGAVFGERILDYHHALDHPPDPLPDTLTPTWDPERRWLKIMQRLQRGQ
jgi:hypothetical protein